MRETREKIIRLQPSLFTASVGSPVSFHTHTHSHHTTQHLVDPSHRRHHLAIRDHLRLAQCSIATHHIIAARPRRSHNPITGLNQHCHRSIRCPPSRQILFFRARRTTHSQAFKSHCRGRSTATLFSPLQLSEAADFPSDAKVPVAPPSVDKNMRAGSHRHQ